MNLLEMLEYDPHTKKSWVGSRDPRVKLAFSFHILIVVILVSDWRISLLYLLLLQLVISNIFGKKHLLRFIWGMKWYFILIFIIQTLFLLISSTTDMAFIDTVLVSLQFLAQLTVLLLSFFIFNQTTSPDEVVDSLIKLRVPPFAAWLIGASMRQAMFLIDDLQDIQAMYRMRKRKSKYGLVDRVNETIAIFISFFSRAIQNAGEMADVLAVRGFERAHRDITLHSTKISRDDLIFFVLTILLPILLTYILLRSNFNMSLEII